MMNIKFKFAFFALKYSVILALGAANFQDLKGFVLKCLEVSKKAENTNSFRAKQNKIHSYLKQ